MSVEAEIQRLQDDITGYDYYINEGINVEQFQQQKATTQARINELQSQNQPSQASTEETTTPKSPNYYDPNYNQQSHSEQSTAIDNNPEKVYYNYENPEKEKPKQSTYKRANFYSAIPEEKTTTKQIWRDDGTVDTYKTTVKKETKEGETKTGEKVTSYSFKTRTGIVSTTAQGKLFTPAFFSGLKYAEQTGGGGIVNSLNYNLRLKALDKQRGIKTNKIYEEEYSDFTGQEMEDFRLGVATAQVTGTVKDVGITLVLGSAKLIPDKKVFGTAGNKYVSAGGSGGFGSVNKLNTVNTNTITAISLGGVSTGFIAVNSLRVKTDFVNEIPFKNIIDSDEYVNPNINENINQIINKINDKNEIIIINSNQPSEININKNKNKYWDINIEDIKNKNQNKNRNRNEYEYVNPNINENINQNKNKIINEYEYAYENAFINKNKNKNININSFGYGYGFNLGFNLPNIPSFSNNKVNIIKKNIGFKLKRLNIKKRYTPSLSAVVFDIRGKKPSNKFFTGLETRPIVNRRKKPKNPFKNIPKPFGKKRTKGRFI